VNRGLTPKKIPTLGSGRGEVSAKRAAAKNARLRWSIGDQTVAKIAAKIPACSPVRLRIGLARQKFSIKSLVSLSTWLMAKIARLEYEYE